jgi:hypothetical protein
VRIDPEPVSSIALNFYQVATSGGTVIGQVCFGALADIVGRKRMYGLELIIIIFATLAQALSSNSPSMSIVGVIIFWRVIMGIGIGGDYPLSSIITSEFATTKWRGAMMVSIDSRDGDCDGADCFYRDQSLPCKVLVNSLPVSLLLSPLLASKTLCRVPKLLQYAVVDVMNQWTRCGV